MCPIIFKSDLFLRKSCERKYLFVFFQELSLIQQLQFPSDKKMSMLRLTSLSYGVMLATKRYITCMAQVRIFYFVMHFSYAYLRICDFICKKVAFLRYKYRWSFDMCRSWVYLQGVPKRTQHLLKLSISKALVNVSFGHLYHAVG